MLVDEFLQGTLRKQSSKGAKSELTGLDKKKGTETQEFEPEEVFLINCVGRILGLGLFHRGVGAKDRKRYSMLEGKTPKEEQEKITREFIEEYDRFRESSGPVGQLSPFLPAVVEETDKLGVVMLALGHPGGPMLCIEIAHGERREESTDLEVELRQF